MLFWTFLRNNVFHLNVNWQQLNITIYEWLDFGDIKSPSLVKETV